MKAATGQHQPVYEDDIESDLTDLSDGDDEFEEEEEQQSLPPPSTTAARSIRRTVSAQSKPKGRRALPSWRTSNYSTQTCLKWIHDDMIYLEAEYQRDVVWSEQKMSMLIDSIMNNYYMPPIIFCVKTDPDTRMPTQRICIDGKQRLTSIQRFMDGDLCHKDAVNGKKLWFNAKGIRGRKEMTKESKDYFENLQLVCVEYNDLEDKEERELFSRVQNGIALTPAERMQAFNGPYADLVRKVGKEVTKCFGDQLNWGKLRGRDFQSIAQILYLIEYSSNSTRSPPEPSTAKVETWLNSNVQKDCIPDKVERSARTVFLLLCVLVLDIDGKGWDEPFKSGPHKFSPVEFVLSAYMIFLHGKDLTVSQLSAGVKHLRNYARSRNEEFRFNSTTYKDLVKYVRKEVKAVVTKEASLGDHGLSAFKWSEDNRSRLQEEIENMKLQCASSLSPSTLSKRKGKTRVKKDGDLADSDGRSRKKPLKQAASGTDDPKPPKARQKMSISSTSTLTQSGTSVVKTEKTAQKRVKPDDGVDEKPPKKRRIAELGSPALPQSTVSAGTKTTKVAAISRPTRPTGVVKGPRPLGAAAVTPGTPVSSLSVLSRKSQQSQLATKPCTTSHATPEHSILPSSTALSGGTFPSSGLASSCSPPQQISSADTSTAGPPSFLSFPVGGAQPHNPTIRPPSAERLSSLREAKQRIEKDAAINGGRSTSSPSALQCAPGANPRDPRPRRNVSGTGSSAVLLSPAIPSTLPESKQSHSPYGYTTQPSQVSQLEQRPVHPGQSLPYPSSTLPPILMPDPSSQTTNFLFTASTATTTIAMTSYADVNTTSTLPPKPSGLPAMSENGTSREHLHPDTPSPETPSQRHTNNHARPCSRYPGDSPRRGARTRHNRPLPRQYDHYSPPSPSRQYDHYSPPPRTHPRRQNGSFYRSGETDEPYRRGGFPPSGL